VKKEAINNIRQKGFDSKAQMRYLLYLAREYPEKYSFVYDILGEHGVPSEDGPFHTYWTGPYKVSPDTPSYVYTGRSAMVQKLVRVAQHLDDVGRPLSAKRVDAIAQRVFLDEELANKVANMYWIVRKDEISTDPEKLIRWFDKLQEFKPYQQLDSATQQEVERILGDKILGR
jgi:hypothetical protein